MYCRAVTPKDHKEFYVLAYKSFVEREDVGIDFNETVFNQIVKNTLVHESHHIQGLFEDDMMVGFCVVMLDKIPFSSQPIAIFDLIHTDVSHRHIDNFQLMFTAIMKVVAEHGVKKLCLNSKNLILDEDQKTILLSRNDFTNQSINWEKNL